MLDINKYLESMIPKHDPSFIVTTEFLSVEDDVSNNIPVLLTGHSGAGKSFGIIELAAKYKKPLIRINLSSETTRAGLIGTKTIDSKQDGIKWVDGGLTLAARYGCYLLLDEIDYGVPDIIAPLNAVLETKNINRKMFIEENNCELVDIHPDMRIFATANSIGIMSKFRGTLYPSTYIMNDAQLRRWSVYYIPYLDKEDEISAIAKKLNVDKKEPIFQVIRILTEMAYLCRESLYQQKINTAISTGQLIEVVAKIISMGKNGISKNNKTILRTALDTQIMNKIKYPSDAAAIKEIINRVNAEPLY